MRGMLNGTPRFSGVRRFFRASAAGALLLASVSEARAEYCWDYMDAGFAAAPFQCVFQNLSPNCSWAGGANDCTTIPDPANLISCTMDSDCDQTACPPSRPNCRYTCASGQCRMNHLRMHEEWHQCFGAVGRSDGNNPPGRGGRWYAFHRQFEVDFNLDREATHPCAPPAVTSGCKIESVDWCPNVNLRHGHFGAGLMPGDHPAGCGIGAGRPPNVPCVECIAFPECLFHPGAGPMACPGSPSSVCSTGMGITYPYASLEEFPNVEEVSNMLDGYFHGEMHGAVQFGDGASPYTNDLNTSTCSPRDPMFWRLHKALDDVVRAWQDRKAVDVMVVVDRSGSMSATDATGAPKYEVALEALDLFADLLEDGRSDGQTNRIGVASYATGGSVDMGLTDVDATLRAPGGPLQTAMTNIAASVGGCTSIGSGLDEAIDELCVGNCDGHVPGAGENSRKAVLLLTDGLENRPPCLNPQAPAATPSCGSVCGGPQFDFTRLGSATQLCAVGFGQEGSLNQNLLTLLAERQGGIYTQTPDLDNDGQWTDLKDFFVKCFGQLSDEFVGLDPRGHLAPFELASPPVAHSSCGDERLTFVGGWSTAVEPRDLRLLVNAPDGSLVRSDAPGVESSFERKWSFTRVPLPLDGQASGEWRSQLIRPHRSYVNAFTTDSLPTGVSVPLVRQQIQRLCPDGCSSVLYFEDGRLGPESSYELALQAEEEAGLLSAVVSTSDVADFSNRLGESWDLIVYAHQATAGAEVYDSRLTEVLCGASSTAFQQRAIVTDTRIDTGALCQQSEDCTSGLCFGGLCVEPGFLINVCAGAPPTGEENWTELIGDGGHCAGQPQIQCSNDTACGSNGPCQLEPGRLIEGRHALTNFGYERFSYFLNPPIALETPGEVQAFHDGTTSSVPAAITATGSLSFRQNLYAAQDWFVDVLVRGLSKLDPHDVVGDAHTGEDLIASVRILPSFIPSGGYDEVVARVEVEHPTVGVGATLLGIGQQPESPAGGEVLDGRAAAYTLAGTIPTSTSVFFLNDDGVDGDVEPANGTYGVRTDLGTVDGMHRLHFTLDLTKNGCTTRRELVKSVFVDVGVDPGSSTVDVVATDTGVDVTVFPRDRFGNPWGWGRPPTPECTTDPGCHCDPAEVIDNGDGSYTIPIRLDPGTPVAFCRMKAFDTDFIVPVAPECVGDDTAPSITAVSLDPSCLWPPNHKLVPYALDSEIVVQAVDACDPNPVVRIVGVESSDPENGVGDGNTASDVVFTSDRLCLRSERSGKSAGRLYTITVEASDVFGNTSQTQTVVTVGRDQAGPQCRPVSPDRFVEDGDPRCRPEPAHAGHGLRTQSQVSAGSGDRFDSGPPEPSGCGCRVGGRSSTTTNAAMGLVGLSLMLFLRRRRPIR